MAGRRTIRSQGWSVSSAGPFTAALTAVSELSVGSGVFVIFFFSLAHLTASALSRRTTTVRIRPVMRDGCLEGATILSRLPVAFPPPTLGHPMPAEELRSPHGRLTDPKAGPRRGYRFPHARAAAGVGASYTPRTAVLIPAEGRARPAPADPPRRVLRPRSKSHPREAVFYEASVRGLGSSPVRPAPRL